MSVVLSLLANEGDSFGMAGQGDNRAAYAHSRCKGKKSPSYLLPLFGVFISAAKPVININ